MMIEFSDLEDFTPDEDDGGNFNYNQKLWPKKTSEKNTWRNNHAKQGGVPSLKSNSNFAPESLDGTGISFAFPFGERKKKAHFQVQTGCKFQGWVV